MEYLKYFDLNKRIRQLISAPIIYWAVIWFIIFDLFLEIYHRICFPLYWLEIIDRKKYFKYDRRKLPYLSYLQKFNCFYCSYGNWLITYAREIVGQTEKYWCGIRHEETSWFIEPLHHEEFIPYWDEKAFYETYGKYENECKLLVKK
jgi:hypothetical protein